MANLLLNNAPGLGGWIVNPATAESFIDVNGVSSVKVTIVENTVVEVVGE